jgi:hypothetical protein
MKCLAILILLDISFCFAQSFNLRDTTNQYDYIIITTPEFSDSIESFKAHKTNYDHFNVLVVDTAMIYSQFHDSSTNQDKIRNFISFAGKYWRYPNPKYILLAGNRQNIPNFGFYSYNGILIYSDYLYTQSIYDFDSCNTDFYVGRVPASNITELTNYLNKVISYDTMDTISSWQNNVLFVAEDDISFDFINSADYDAGFFPTYIHSDLITNGETYSRYGNKDSIIQKLNSGVSSLWLYGHTYDTCFINNNYLNLDDLNLHNKDRYFLTFAYTQHLAYNKQVSMMDKLILSPYGSIGGIARCGPTYYNILMYSLYTLAMTMYQNDNLSFGDYLALYLPYPTDYVHFNEKQIESIWGDPSIKIKFDKTTNIKETGSHKIDFYNLAQNYPNPFNPNTVISYSIPSASNVKLIIFNSLGQKLKTLENEFKLAGNYSINFNASNLPSGIYFYKLETGQFSQIKKMMILK